MSTAGTIKFRVQAVGPDDPNYQISVDEFNDSFVVTGGVDGQVMVRDSAQDDGWGWATISMVPPDPLITSTIKGGTGAASTLTLQPTSGNGGAGSDIIFKVGNDGATEAFRIKNDGEFRMPRDKWLYGLHSNGSTERKVLRYSSDHTELGCETGRPVTGVDNGNLYLKSVIMEGELLFQSAGYAAFSLRTVFRSPVNGSLTLTNWAENDFGLLQLGGTTASFPALKRSAAELQVRVADDSAFADMRVRTLAFGVNNVYFTGRNAANTADVNMFKVNASNQIDVGAAMNTAALTVGGSLSTTGGNSITSSGSVSAVAAGYLNWTGRSRTYSPADGVIVLGNNADTGFTRLGFGGTSASFPALKRNAAMLDTRLADDSGYAQHNMSALGLVDGMSAPAAVAGQAAVFVDSADHDVKVVLGSGATKRLTVAKVLGLTIDGGGSVITTGVKGFLVVPVACTITQATLLSTDPAATAGSIVIDIWKDVAANYPPTVADTIVASAPPTLSSANKSIDSTLTGWTKTLAAGDILGFNVNSASGVTRVTLSLTVTPT